MQADTDVTSGDVSWILTSSVLVWIMIPAVGLIYSGYSSRETALSMLWLCLMSISVVTFQWWLWGYSLAFSRTSESTMIGDLHNVVFLNVLNNASASEIQAPELAFAVYQGMFAAFTMAVVTAATSERGRSVPFMIFIFLWTTCVYDFIVFWSWNDNGWLHLLGSLDWAGGSPVHIASGVSSLAYSMILGHPRNERNQNRRQSIENIMLGSLLLWFGWFGFNAGSALRANLRAFLAFINTNLAASCAGLTWAFLDRFLGDRFKGNVGYWSLTGFMSGALAGLVCITPGAGYVPPWSAPIFGIVAAVLCNRWCRLIALVKTGDEAQSLLLRLLGKLYIVTWILERYDDPLDVCTTHALGGFVGLFLTGIFASNEMVALDPGAHTDPRGMGVIDGNAARLGYQVADGLACGAWAFVITFAIVYMMSLIPGLHLQYDSTVQTLDEYELGDKEPLIHTQQMGVADQDPAV